MEVKADYMWDGPEAMELIRTNPGLTARDAIARAWSGSGHKPIVALCKETRALRQEVGLLHDMCNCG